ncbi:MAG: hypothetical protein XD60_1588 [Acetothermia bacterium 64_32]|nr:MAG: hypothetical protein XD60_1588 [Acetothermia bacterium 64_32]
MDGYDLVFPNGPDSGYVAVEELRLNGAVHEYSIDDTILEVIPEGPLPSGVPIELHIKFRVKIPNAISRFGHDKGNYYISWWYPRLAAHDEEGWHPCQAHGTFPDEPYGNFASYWVEITVPQGMVVGATGALKASVENPDGTKTLIYTAENVHDFAWVADRRYRVQTTSWNGITIRSLYFPEDEDAGRRAARYAEAAISYFSERYGDYPYGDFTVAETRMMGGAMEYPQLIMVTYQLYRLPRFLTLLDEVIAHETSHQWFYGMLLNDQTNEAWLDEGFATFSEISYMEYKYGRDGNMFDPSELERIPVIGPFLVGTGAVGALPAVREQVLMGPYIAAASMGTEEALLTPREEISPGHEPLFYQRGALTLFALQYLVGEETFEGILRTYVDRYRFKRVTTEDFIEVAEEVSGQDLGWFFDGWLRSTEHLDYVLEGVSTHKVGEKFVTRVAVRNAGGLRMPVDVQVTLTDGEKITRRFWPLDRRGTLTFVTDRPVNSAVIDPEKVLPDLDRSNNESLPQFSLSPLIAHGTGDEDGLILGLGFQSSDGRAGGQLGYATRGRKPVYLLTLVSSPWTEAGRLAGRGRGFGLRFDLADDGHVFSAALNAGHHFSLWMSDSVKWFNYVAIQPSYVNLYDVCGDRGMVSWVELDGGFTLEGKGGWRASLELNYQGSLALRSDFRFERCSLELRLRQRILWRTHLNGRLFWGALEGEPPDGEGRFDIQRDAGFRTFAREDERVVALNLAFHLPIQRLNLIDLGPIPISFGLNIFGNLGWFGPGLGVMRAEVGWGLTCGPYDSGPLLRLEQVLWVNTEEDGGGRRFCIGIDMGI